MSKKLGLILSLFAGACGSTESASSQNPAAVFVKGKDVAFESILPEVAEFGTVYGDRATGRHGTFVKLKKGGATPAHLHSAAYHAVVLAGLLENPTPSSEGSPVTMPAGSYYFVPANAEHVTRCAAASPTDCLTFFYQDAAFDFVPVP